MDDEVGEPVKEPLSETLSDPSKYRKAIMGGVLAGVTTAATASVDGFTTPELWGVAAAIVTVFVGVFGVTNQRGG